MLDSCKTRSYRETLNYSRAVQWRPTVDELFRITEAWADRFRWRLFHRSWVQDVITSTGASPPNCSAEAKRRLPVPIAWRQRRNAFVNELKRIESLTRAHCPGLYGEVV